MFQCPMCPRLLKSRSGLSGHLQWKHATKLQALKAAPEQLGPAPAKALEAAPGVVPLEHIVDGLECTLYMVDNDVIRLVEAIEMQEIILWDINTDVGLLQTEMKDLREQHKKAMEVIAQGMAKLTAEVKCLSQHIVRLNGKIETLAADRHPPGFSREKSCKAGCNIRLKELEADTEKLLDYRFTAEKLKRLGF